MTDCHVSYVATQESDGPNQSIAAGGSYAHSGAHSDKNDADTPVIRMYAVHAKDPYGKLTGLDLAISAGFVGVLLGEPASGTTVLVDVVGGVTRPSDGLLTINGREPYHCASLRQKLAIFAAYPQLPDVGTVSDLFRLSARLRGYRLQGETLRSGLMLRDEIANAIGFESLLKKRVGKLTQEQRRTVAFALACMLPTPVAVVLYEPLCDVQGMTISLLQTCLEQWTRALSCVLIVTSRVADAVALARPTVTLMNGRVARSVGNGQFDVLLPGGPSLSGQLAIVCDCPRQLAAELLRQQIGQGVAWNGQAGQPVFVLGQPLGEVSRGVVRIALQNGINIESIDTWIPGLQDVNAAGEVEFVTAYQASVHVPAKCHHEEVGRDGLAVNAIADNAAQRTNPVPPVLEASDSAQEAMAAVAASQTPANHAQDGEKEVLG